jgi:hypothetical protein
LDAICLHFGLLFIGTSQTSPCVKPFNHGCWGVAIFDKSWLVESWLVVALCD